MKIRNTHDYPYRNNFRLTVLPEKYQVRYDKFKSKYNKEFIVNFFKNVLFENNINSKNLNITFKYLYLKHFFNKNSFDLP